MTALWRPATNYKTGSAGVAIAVADNPSLDAADVTFTGKTDLVVLWAGPLPTVAGAGLVARVPKLWGASGTITLDVAVSRMEVLGTGSTSFRVEKSPGGGAFVATTVTTLTHTSTDYEKTSSSLAAITVTTGDLLRIYFATVSNGSGGAYEVELIGKAP